MRNVRNFWLDATIDGYKNDPTFKGGPRSKTGGMTIEVLQRTPDNIVQAIRVECNASDDGVLTTRVYHLEKLIFEVRTKRDY